MGRKSKLSDADWDIIARRLREGISARELGAEFGVSEATIRWRFPARRMGAAAQAALPLAAQTSSQARSIPSTSPSTSAQHPLPGVAQTANRQLAMALQGVTEHLSGAALTGAEMARRLSDMAEEQVAQLESLAYGTRDGATAHDAQDESNRRAIPDRMTEAIKRIQLLTAALNNAAELGMNLLKANKELTQAEGEPTPVTIAFTVKDARADADHNIFAEPAAGAVSATAA